MDETPYKIQQEDAAVKLIENAKDIAKKISNNILKIFNKDSLNGLASKIGFVQRSTGRIEGEDFVRLMTAEILGEESVSCEGLCDILRQINPKADMTPQAMNGRLNKKESAHPTPLRNFPDKIGFFLICNVVLIRYKTKFYRCHRKKEQISVPLRMTI